MPHFLSASYSLKEDFEMAKALEKLGKIDNKINED